MLRWLAGIKNSQQLIILLTKIKYINIILIYPIGVLYMRLHN